ncbi:MULTISPECIES: YjfB family protein [Giesbergeria]|uniref:YjfB family protein n=1 Tax=Giesbergeria sinuosa TaxID=80883 RepID=A0ABV9QDK7_9BURK
MDVSLTNQIINTATAMNQAKTAQEVSTTVLKKSMDMQESAAATLLQALPQVPPLATSGSLGTQVNTYA